MRITAVTPLYPPASRVGAWLATHQLLRQLVERDHEVSVFAYQAYGRPYELDGVRVQTGSLGKHVMRTSPTPDLVVSHMADGGVGARFARDAHAPNVQLQHGAIRKVVGAPALAVFNSHHMRVSTLCEFPSIVVHPVTDFAAHRVEATGDEISLVNIGIDKGGLVWWRLAEQMPDRRFLAVKGGYSAGSPAGGSGGPRGNNLTVMPTCRDMRDVWARTRILVMPSKYETWGMVGVEAMSNGIPVIATDLPGLRESLGDAGIFVAEQDDLAAWRAEIERLDDPDEYAAASRRALDRTRELAVDFEDGTARFVAAVEALAEGRPLDVEATACNH